PGARTGARRSRRRAVRALPRLARAHAARRPRRSHAHAARAADASGLAEAAARRREPRRARKRRRLLLSNPRRRALRRSAPRAAARGPSRHGLLPRSSPSPRAPAHDARTSPGALALSRPAQLGFPAALRVAAAVARRHAGLYGGRLQLEHAGSG